MTRNEIIIVNRVKNKETKYRDINKKTVIYAIININNGKMYIGSTTCFYKRRSGHLRDLERNKHHSILLQRSYNKHGSNAFEFDILEVLEEKSNRVFYEQKWLDLTMSANPKYGYNILPNADETCAGRSHTLERRRRQSEIMKIVCNTPEHKAMVSVNSKKIWTEEKRKSMSEMRKGVKCNNVECKIKAEDYLVIQDMLKQGVRQGIIAKLYNVDSSMISRIKTGKRGSRHNKIN